MSEYMLRTVDARSMVRTDLPGYGLLYLAGSVWIPVTMTGENSMELFVAVPGSVRVFSDEKSAWRFLEEIESRRERGEMT